MGEGASRRTIGGATIPGSGGGAGSGASMAVRSSTSDLPGLEVDARIDPGIGEVGDQVHHEPEQGEDKERREHHRIVAVEQALEAEQAETVERKDRLDQERAGEEGANERARKARNDDQHGVAENV